MKTKIEEFNQAEIDRLLRIEKAAKAVVENEKTFTIHELSNAIKGIQKPKYKHSESDLIPTYSFTTKLYRDSFKNAVNDINHLKLVKLLLDYKDTYCFNYVFNSKENNYFLYISDDGFKVDWHRYTFNPTVVYMSKGICEQFIQDIEDGVIDIKELFNNPYS